MASERIRYIYKKNETRLLRVHRTPFKALIGLVNNQHYLVSTNIVLESMHLNPHQEPQETQESDTFKTNKLPQLKQTSAPMGLDYITISEELEQLKDESPPDATAGCNDLLTRK